jgi:hypothetical protein
MCSMVKSHLPRAPIYLMAILTICIFSLTLNFMANSLVSFHSANELWQHATHPVSKVLFDPDDNFLISGLVMVGFPVMLTLILIATWNNWRSRHASPPLQPPIAIINK